MGKSFSWMMVFLISLLSLVFFASHKGNAKSLSEHQGKQYETEGEPIALMNGCKVTEVKVFDGQCSRTAHFYVTNCSSVTWYERHNKSSALVINVTNK